MTLTTARRRVNNSLHDLGTRYHDGIPVHEIDAILVANNFDETEPAIYCGRVGRALIPVGQKAWLALSWYKMESGRYEIVAYIS